VGEQRLVEVVSGHSAGTKFNHTLTWLGQQPLRFLQRPEDRGSIERMYVEQCPGCWPQLRPRTLMILRGSCAIWLAAAI
jgi:hypothetical protein